MAKPSSQLKIAIQQMTSASDKAENLKSILEAFGRTDARCLFFPENSLYFNTNKGPIPFEVAFTAEDPEIQKIQETCAKLGRIAHLGGIPWKSEDPESRNVENAALVIRENGDLESPYLKTHLFDLELENLRVMESDSYTAGRTLFPFAVDGWHFATAICYDLRFAELFVDYRAQHNVDAFLVPSAFTAKTGAAHWEILLRARAIESQAYVLAPAQVGGHWSVDKSLERKTWGQSMAVDPWGQILAQDINHTVFGKFKNPDKGPIEILLERDRLSAVRRAMPMEDHRAFKMTLESRCLLPNS